MIKRTLLCEERLDDLGGEELGDLLGIGRADIEDEVIGAGIDIGLHKGAGGTHVSRCHHQLNGTGDSGGVASNGGAVIIQDSIFMLEVLSGAARVVPDSSVLGNDAQSEFFAAATDHKGRIGLLNGLRFAASPLQLIIFPGEIRGSLRPHKPDDLAGLAKAAKALARRIERDTVGIVLKLIPARANAKIEATL